MIKKYFINFWIWWYYVNAGDILGDLLRFWLLILGKLNVVPMLSNLFVPLYQDYSAIGRFISFMIRLVWSFFGIAIFLIVGVPILALMALYLIAPIFSIYQVVIFFIK